MHVGVVANGYYTTDALGVFSICEERRTMIVQNNTSASERGGDFVVESTFKIKSTSKAFKILSDSLYSDKPLAIVRELCCNAYDSHVAAGKKDEPFTVHLPSIMEPYFSVIDYGTGLTDFQVRGGWFNQATGHVMSHEEGDDLAIEHKLKETPASSHPLFGYEKVGGIFTTYFESTKSDSNDYIGALGLGSKSPFSYVDNFTVVSRIDGKKLSYTMFLNEDECPSVAKLFEEETTEPNGLEISLHIRRHDMNTFVEKARIVLEWFHPEPNITGYQGFKIFPRKYCLEGTGWRLMQSTGSYYRPPFLAVQGRIAYPIKVDSLRDLSQAQRVVVNHPFVVDFQIGELDVAASREHLSFKNQTNSNILKRVDTIIEELPRKFQSKIDECQTLWEAKIKLSELGTSNNIIGELLSTQAFNAQYQGKDLDTRDFEIRYADLPGMSITKYQGRGTTRFVADEFEQHRNFTVSAHKTILFYVNDLPRGGPGRTQNHHKNNFNNITYLISCDDKTVIEKFFQALGNPQYAMASSLPKPEYKKGISKSAIQIAKNTWNDTYKFESLAEDVDLDEGGFYVPLLRGSPVNVDGTKIYDLAQMIATAKAMGLLAADEPVYGVTRAAMNQINGHSEWQLFTDVLVDRFNVWLSKTKLADLLATKQAMSEWQTLYYWTSTWLTYLTEDHLGVNHPLYTFKVELNQARTIDTDRAEKMAGLLGVSAATSGGVSSYRFTSVWADMVAKYPLITMGTRINNADEMAHLVDYFKLSDGRGSTV